MKFELSSVSCFGEILSRIQLTILDDDAKVTAASANEIIKHSASRVTISGWNFCVCMCFKSAKVNDYKLVVLCYNPGKS